jgi:hypothetical protein
LSINAAADLVNILIQVSVWKHTICIGFGDDL